MFCLGTICITLVLGCILQCDAKVVPIALFGDGMVLQTHSEGGPGPGKLYGIADPAETVQLVGSNFPGSPYHVKPNAQGQWSIQLANDDNAKAGPYTLTISALRNSKTVNSVTATDVWFGDVYFCSGQSNMVYGTNAIYNSAYELKHADHPNLRLFQLNRDDRPHIIPFSQNGHRNPHFGFSGDTASPTHNISGSCLYDAGGDPGNHCRDPVSAWRKANSTWVWRFSAICYMAARDVLQNHTKNRAIGLIESDYGGTPIQAWSPPEALKSCGMSTTDCKTEKGGDCKGYPSHLYNRMVFPFTGYNLRAVMWYQGEANSDEGFPLLREEYFCLFKAMIVSWRSAWNLPGMPFVFMQLSAWTGNWGFDDLPCTETYCPVITRIRLAQADVVGQGGLGNTPLPYAGMAYAFDWGDNQDHGVHPRFKTEPARRMALQLLQHGFGQKVALAPRFQAATTNYNGNVVTVTFKMKNDDKLHLVPANLCKEQYSKKCCDYGDGKPLIARICTASKIGDCASDGDKIINAHVEIKDGVLLATADVTNSINSAQYIDFSFTDFPECIVVNSAGLPLGPFGPVKLQ